MPLETITGTYAAGFYVLSGYNLIVGSTGRVEGKGVYTSSIEKGLAVIVNYGSVVGSAYGSFSHGQNGIRLNVEGIVQNGSVTDTSAYIKGYRYGVCDFSGSAGDVENLGTISSASSAYGAAVFLENGGSVVNGSSTDPNGYISGNNIGVSIAGAGGSVTNLAGIFSISTGVVLEDGGSVVNGGSTDLNGGISIGGQIGDGVSIAGAAGSVTNFAGIYGQDKFGVALAHGGVVTNGSTADTGADISGGIAGVYGGRYGATTVTNFGTIGVSNLPSRSGGIVLDDGGLVINGSAGDPHARIAGGYDGVLSRYKATTLVNYGRIVGKDGYGVGLGAGSAITNGSAGDKRALIAGGNGGAYLLDGGVIDNFATIAGDLTGYFAGVNLVDGGTLFNGSAGDTTALVEGYVGLRMDWTASASNLGTIRGTGDLGAQVLSGSALTNGSSAYPHATVEGYLGVTLASSSQLTNFGTVDGYGGTAVSLDSTSNLVAETGAVFEGAVLGGGGTLELAAGSGTLTLLAGDSLSVSGPAPTTTFSDFGTVQLDAGPGFTVVSGGTIAAGQDVIDDGALTAAGSLTLAGDLSGAGSLALAGGDLTLSSSASLGAAQVVETGAALASFAATDLTYAGVWTQTAGAVSVSAGEGVNFTGNGDAFDGTLAGAGTIALLGPGSDILTGTTLSAKSVIINGPTVTLGGAIDLTGNLTATSKDMIIAAGGVTLSGKGTLVLTNTATNTIVGASSGATLTNDDTIKGAGQLGAGTMTLDNAAGALISGTGSVALTINTGVNAIANAGTIKAFGPGGVVIASALDNTGILIANPGTLTVNGAVTGSGHANVNGGTAVFTQAFNENVDFTGTTGVLELSQAYSGNVSGLSAAGTNSIVLLDVAYEGVATGVYSGTTTSGVLTVTEGSQTATIHLVGDYSSGSFKLSEAPGGGTQIVDPAKTPTAPHLMGPTPPHQFISAAASFGAPRAGSVSVASYALRAPSPSLALPRPQMA